MDTARGEVFSKRKAFVIEIRCITNFYLDFSFILDFIFFENGCIKPFKALRGLCILLQPFFNVQTT